MLDFVYHPQACELPAPPATPGWRSRMLDYLAGAGSILCFFPARPLGRRTFQADDMQALADDLRAVCLDYNLAVETARQAPAAMADDGAPVTAATRDR